MNADILDAIARAKAIAAKLSEYLQYFFIYLYL